MYEENTRICQSCGMPLQKPEEMGSEKDGSKNEEYCRYCYSGGAFTNPGLTLDTMLEHIKKQMQQMNMDTPSMARAENTLSKLKRWRAKPAATN